MEIGFIAVTAILGILLIIVTIKYILYRRQVINICRQMVFIRENYTRKGNFKSYQPYKPYV